MKYTFSYQNPSSRYLDIELEVEATGKTTIHFQLPAWRPGRYELGNFAKNIQKWKAYNETQTELPFKKVSKDLWEVDCRGSEKVIVKYNYFSNDLNAGSTFLSEDQMYVNPVNCCLYLPDRMDETCQIELKVPTNYSVAIGLDEKAKNSFAAKNFDELADSPFIASATLKHHEFNVLGTKFHLWFQGEFKPDWNLLEKDFRAYTEEQIKLFGDFPTNEFHYLFQVLPKSAYHGVEHSASTVILLGPSHSLLKKEGRYEDLLGVSSHELFHTWNIKRIRPVEMLPYDFSKENYSRLGYLAEGATTWYGDLMLYRSGVFDDLAFFKTFNQLLDRHYNNPGVSNLSVADSSFDTWLDGYSLGVPNRKSSIYTEGALLTFILDYLIRKNTNNKNSFDEVLKKLYQGYSKHNKGVSEADYKKEVEASAGVQFDSFFSDYINGTEDLSDKLDEALSYVGLKREQKPSELYHEAYLGIKLNEEQVLMIYPESPAEKAGISIGDKIHSINSIQPNNDLSQWLEYFKEDTIELSLVDSFNNTKRVEIKLDEKVYFSKNVVFKVENPSEEQLNNQKAWMETKRV